MALYLQIHRVGNTLTAWIYEGANFLQRTVRQYDTCAVTDEKINALCEQMENALKNAVYAESEDRYIEQLRAVGLDMWLAFIPETVAERLHESESQPLILDITDNLVTIPWELLYNGEWFLCQHYAVGRIVTTEQEPRQLPRDAQKLPIRMLIVADPAGDLPASHNEGKEVLRTLKNRKGQFDITYQSEINVMVFQSRLLACDVAYYTGHADHFPDQVDRSGLKLVDGEVFNIEAIKALRRVKIPPPLLIFANACKSGQTEGWTNPKETYGIANAFLLAGVPYYVGTFCNIPDTERASFFGIAFLEGLVDNLSIGEALMNARKKAINKFGEGAIFWASYMLYGNPTHYLFDQQQPTAAANTVQEETSMKLSLALTSGKAAANEAHFDEARRHYDEAEGFAQTLGENQEWLNLIAGFRKELEKVEEQSKDEGEKIREGNRPSTLAQFDHYKNLKRIEFDNYRTLYTAESYNRSIPDPTVVITIPNLQEPEQRQEQSKAFRPLKSLKHPGVIRVFDAKIDTDIFYTVEEYPGKTKLSKLLAEGRSLQYPKAKQYALEICSALAAVHRQGLTHESLTPEKIYITKDDHVKIKDVGVARILQTIGNNPLSGERPSEMAELASQLQTPIQDTLQLPEIDVVMSAVLIYQMLTGGVPYDLTKLQSVQRPYDLIPKPPSERNTDVPMQVSNVIMRALTGGYLNIGAFTLDLQRVFSDQRHVLTDFDEDIRLYLKAGYPLLYLLTDEESRCIDKLEKCVRQLRKEGEAGEEGSINDSDGDLKFYTWSATKGLDPPDLEKQLVPTSSRDLLRWIQTLEKSAVIVLPDFEVFFTDPSVVDFLSHLTRQLRDRKQTVIILSSRLSIPVELEKKVTVLEMSPPAPEEIRELIGVERARLEERGVEVAVKPEDINQFIWHGLGMTDAELRQSVKKSVEKHGKLSVICLHDLQKDKAQLVRNSGMLELWYPKVTFADVGGVSEVAEWVRERELALRYTGQERELPFPKGILIAGVPGCGKSLCAKAIAGEWKVPLLRFDMGRILDSRLGASESNLFYAVNLAEQVCPVVLWIDEAEKGFAGYRSTGAGGTLSRLLGIFLTWLQEKQAPIFVVATTNDLEALPIEFLQTGRFDRAFFLGFPTRDDRYKILEIVLKKYKLNDTGIDIVPLVDASEYFTGVEIEEAIKSAIYRASSEGKTQLRTEDLQRVLQSTKTLFQRDPERLRELDERWRQVHEH